MRRFSWAAVFVLALVIVMPLPVAAPSEAVDFDYLIGTGPLRGVPVPAPCRTSPRHPTATPWR